MGSQHGTLPLDTEVLKSKNQAIKALSDEYTYAALPIRLMQSVLKEIDAGAFAVWMHLYLASNFTNGEVTSSISSIADHVGMASSTVSVKLATLEEKGYLAKQHNFDASKRITTRMATTYFVLAPDTVIEAVKSTQPRKKCYEASNQYFTKAFAKDETAIVADVHTMEEQAAQSAKPEIEAAINEHQARINELSAKNLLTLDEQVEKLSLLNKVKALKDSEQKKFPQQSVHTLPRNSEKGYSENRRTILTTSQLGYLKNNNNDMNDFDASNQTLSHNPSTDCSSAAPEKKGYAKDPVAIPKKILDKVDAVIKALPKLSEPVSVREEAHFAIARRFNDSTLEHACNTFASMLRKGTWTTPYPMRQLASNENPIPRSYQKSAIGSEIREALGGVFVH